MTIHQLILPADTKTIAVDDIPRLIAEARHPAPVEIYGNFDWVHDASERKSLQVATESAHKELLYKAIRNGTLVARNCTTGISDPFAEGGLLWTALVDVDDFVRYASQFQIVVTKEPNAINLTDEHDSGNTEGKLSDSEENRLLKHLGAIALLLAEKQGRYCRGNTLNPNVSAIVDSIVELLGELPDCNRNGLGRSSLRESLAKGLKLLKK